MKNIPVTDVAPARMPMPSVGRIVHYYEPSFPDPGPHPAIVTKVWSARVVNLTVFMDGKAPRTKTNVENDDPVASVAFYWAWPPKV